MGVSNSPLELAAKMAVAAKVVGTAASVGVKRGAQVFADAERSAFPSTLRGVGKKGARLGTRMNGGEYAAGAQYLVFMTGPAHLINNDTKAHQIPKQRESASFSGVFGHAVIPNGDEGGVHGKGGVRTKVMSKGTKGKHIWQKTAEVVLPTIPDAIATGTVTALAGIF